MDLMGKGVESAGVTRKLNERKFLISAKWWRTFLDYIGII
jgi:hypothetical protein